MSQKVNYAYSVTSNIAKLLKHLDRLKQLQNGFVTPIMIHTVTTHRCQLNCVHCCFKNREDKTADMDWNMFTDAFHQFRVLGVRAMEFTGGGDPTLWPHINEGILYLERLGYHMGIITNGLGGDKISLWDKFDWVRISLNTLDYRDDLDINYLGTVPRSFCYIWNKHSLTTLPKVIEYSNTHKVACRIMIDCIIPVPRIRAQINTIRKELSKYPNNNYVFLSDFDIALDRKNFDCRIHMIKPCLYLDGWVYACPSAELAVENNKKIVPKARICKVEDIYKWYLGPEATKPKTLDCSYCKYVKQQELLEDLTMETMYNEFA